jgi:hypothetical protein
VAAVKALEAKDSEDGQWREDIDKAVSWYQQFAGFQVVEEVQGKSITWCCCAEGKSPCFLLTIALFP